MIKLYTEEIGRCADCPNYEYREFEQGGGSQDWCWLSKKEIHPMSDEIPKWCKLPTVI
jgi:hypothetical protein